MTDYVTIPAPTRHHTKLVLAFGTFDYLHDGHRSFLKQAKRLGTTLVVSIARDVTVKRLKGKNPVNHERQRLAAIAALPYVDRAVLASTNPKQRFSIIKRFKPNVIALGYDQTHFTMNLAVELAAIGIRCAIVRLKPHHPERFKSSLIKQRLAEKKRT